MANTKRFRACYVCGVEIDDKRIVLEDSVNGQWFIDVPSSSPELIASFKHWFKDVYLKGIPQTLTIFGYDIGLNADGESIRLVTSIHAGKPQTGEK